VGWPWGAAEAEAACTAPSFHFNRISIGSLKTQ
jgi:hypothetical protein